MSNPAFGYFVSRGWTPEQSAGIVGNLFGESRLNPRATGDSGSAYGIAQWHPDRQSTFRRVIGTDIRNSTLEQQLSFVDWELRNTEQRAGNILRGTTNINDATYAVGRYYERPANLSHSIGNRLDAARRAISGALGGKAGDVIKRGLQGVLASNPLTAPFAIGAGALGIGGDGCGINPICYLENWIKESDFFQRMALAVFAFILIIAGVFFLRSNVMQGVLKNVTT